MEGVGKVRMQQIVWRFYQKPMNTPYVIMASTAIPQKVKVTTMVQEVIRRMRNMCKWVEKWEVEEELSKFCGKMKLSGYGEGFRREVLLSGIKGYERMVVNQREGRRKLYRKQDEENWFKGNWEADEEGEEKPVIKGRGGSYVGGVWWK